ncbi:hypothetical protein TD95_002114 [Thielaviopsis punctulata]|uniref:Uncharacterized protein n=1 Tax=Thielaviopsis punctulata TaxID=72032 RepID=A0A0F4ZAA1_9PEZI|nr:hypothetical protein TD95_002114 [Thielaviopsis punctulata]
MNRGGPEAGMSAAERMAALKARVAAAVGNSKGGLAVSLHPALENLNARPAPVKSTHPGKPMPNKYLESVPAGQPAGRTREPRQLQFNQKGKYIQQANAIRRQAALEQIKKRVAEQARKAGLDEVPSDKNFVVEEPPAIEWFDQGYFVEGKTYKDLDDATCLRLEGEDSIVTDLIQHPVPLEPPQDSLVPGAKPMFMTRKEQKKLRRQRRMAEMKEMQAKIRLGLVPAPEPKVKKSNLMRVLGEEAVQDPTAVEARVNRQIAERHETHIKMNMDRQLTKEQRHHKLAENQEHDASKGIHMLVFKIGNLANGQHRYKIWKNAEQHALTGVCLVHPKTNLVIVEGGQYSTNKYKKLMMNRIDWTQSAPPPSGPVNPNNIRDWMASDANTMATNTITLLFEGESKTRLFKKWSSKICDTDKEAFDFLTRVKLESFWAQARQAS